MDVLLSQLKITVLVIVLSSSPSSISDLKMVTSVLQLNLDEGDLMYRGEGNSSLVVSLTKEGKVIRILKDGKKLSSHSEKKLTVDLGSKTGTIKNGILENNRNNNKCNQMKEMKKCKERLIDMIDFNRHVMKRILNHCFLDEPQLVYLNQSQVEIIDQVANVCRPGHRLHKSIPLRDTFALLLPDYCSMKQLASRSSNPSITSRLQSMLTGPVISVEIKPKQGFLPSVESLPSDLKIKSKICRFCLKQFYKMKKGSIGKISNYCPLDLFSGCTDRQSLALKSLIQTPQNNFRIFKDLVHVYGDGALSISATDTIIDTKTQGSPSIMSEKNRLDQILQDFIFKNDSDDSNNVSDSFCDLLLKALNHPFMDEESMNQEKIDSIKKLIHINDPTTCELHLDHESKYRNGESCCSSQSHGINIFSVLGSVYSAQKLDSVDSYRALEMARYLNERYPNFMDELKSKHRRPSEIGSPERLESESLEDFFFRKVWEYIVSLTVKDCSIMITLQRIAGDGQTMSNGANGQFLKQCPLRGAAIIQDDLTSQSYLVTISITDLDPKLPARFADLERKIKEKDYLMVASYNHQF